MRPARKCPPRHVLNSVKDYLGWFRRNTKKDEDPFSRFMGLGLVAEGGTPPPMRLAYPHLINSDSVLKQYSRANWDTVDLRIQRFAAVLIENMRKRGIPLYVHTARRTAKEQAKLHADGFSKIKGPHAPHTLGGAVDIVHSKFHWDMTDDEWEYIGIIGKMAAKQMGLRLEWGGDWRFWDPAHWQLEDWRDGKTGTVNKVPKTPRAILQETANIRMSETTF